MTDRNTMLKGDNDPFEEEKIDLTAEPKDAKSGKAYVEKVRADLEPFKYEISNPYTSNKVTKPEQKLENGITYEGEWNEDGKRDGRGMQHWPDGSVYEGYWKDGMAHGKGRLIHTDGVIQDGDWVADKAHGFGIYIHADGSKYEGEWFEDKQHGSGKEIWPDGT